MHNERVEVAVEGHLQMNNRQSIRNLLATSSVSKSSVHQNVRKQYVHPFKTTLVQELIKNDTDCRKQLDEFFSEQLIVGIEFYILFPPHQNLIWTCLYIYLSSPFKEYPSRFAFYGDNIFAFLNISKF